MAEIIAKPRECCIKFQIKNGFIKEVNFLAKKDVKWQTYLRNETEKIKWVLSLTFQDDFEAFMKILYEMKEKEKFLTYGRNLLDAEREQWELKLQEHPNVAKKKMKELQEDLKKEADRLKAMIDKYTWSK